MRNGKLRIKPLSATLMSISLLSLTGCSIVPGMHMTDQDKFTPALNQHGKTEIPSLVTITPKLILEQRKEQANQYAYTLKNYKAPVGFSATSANYTYHISNQDVLNVIVWDYNSLTNPATNMINTANLENSGFTVNSKGNIFYPYIGDVHVNGLTIAKARDLISKKLSAFLKEPQVTVQVIGFHSQKVNVMGAVRAPKVIPITNVPITVLDAVNAAGGPIRCGNALSNSTGNASNQVACADTRNVTVEHNGKKSVINLDTLRAINNSSENWVLNDNDIVYVPNNDLYKVYVLGETKQTGAFNMIEGKMSLRDAIVAAGGVTQEGAAPEYTYVVRSYASKPEVFTMNMRSPDSLILAGEFDLRPHDVVFVSTSALKDMNQVLQYVSPILSSAFSTAALAITLSR